MSTAWTLAFAALFALTGILAVVVVGVLRRAVVALEQVEQPLSDAPLMPDSPSFEVVGTVVEPPNGYRWHDLGNSTVVFLEADCEGCQLFAVDVTLYRKRALGLSLVIVLDSPSGAFAKLPAEYTVIHDDGRSYAQKWNIQSSPVAYVVDSHGFVHGATHPHTLDDLLKFNRQVVAAGAGH